MQGWIKVYRNLLDKAVWQNSTPEQKTIFVTLLLMVNHQEKEWEWQGDPYKVKPGQVITSLDTIVQKCGKGISIQNVRTALKRFEKYGFLTNQSTNKNRLITIVNWGEYQCGEQTAGNEITGNQQAHNKPITTNKNEENLNNGNKNSTKPRQESQSYDQGSVPFQLSSRLLNSIRKNIPEFKYPNMQKWSNDFRLMLERDNRAVEQIAFLIDWCQEDSFWKSNILSPSKLRKHYDRLILQAQSVKQNRKYKSPQEFTLKRPSHWEDPKPLTEEEINKIREMEDGLPF